MPFIPLIHLATIANPTQDKKDSKSLKYQNIETRATMHGYDITIDSNLIIKVTPHFFQKAGCFYSRYYYTVLEGIRTPDPRLRRPLLYPAELRTHIATFQLRYDTLFFYKCQHINYNLYFSD